MANFGARDICWGVVVMVLGSYDVRFGLNWEYGRGAKPYVTKVNIGHLVDGFVVSRSVDS